MKTERQFLTVIALVVAAAALVCFGRLTSAQLHNKAITSRSADDTQASEAFTPKDHVIYCIARLARPVPNGKYKFVWGRYVPSLSTPQTIFQDEVTYQSGNQVVSKFSSPDDLPAGEYSVNVWAPGGHMRAIFTVKE